MQKPKRLKVLMPGPRLWLNSSIRGRAVIEKDRIKDQFHAKRRPAEPWVREARLRSQYAGEYPGITPGVWMPVSELSAKLIERVYAGRKEGRFTRTFDPTHFEFRGGGNGLRPRAARTRSTDPKL
jgi:hypothetical protein